MRLTHQAHEAVAGVLGEGGLALDATAGNGHDTRFLAEQVGASGHVWALDVQPAAIETTRNRLVEAGLGERVTLLCESHAHIRDQVTPPGERKLDAVMFNLGYLPGSDRTRTTGAVTTIPALEQSMEMLTSGGCLSLMVYRGHDGGDAEWNAIREWLTGSGHEWRIPVDPSDHKGPVLVLLTR
ncbi:class I SAM-dependent methyltransferase [Vreelandella utahensis]|uniref:class I SAM-dependent methyltransferase n=1 Tax=Vreelandella halophila TaxID=86177 RepID=UPI0015C3AC8C|nr:class I SAM-dependent methyltransferase [Halomonas utahensis]